MTKKLIYIVAALALLLGIILPSVAFAAGTDTTSTTGSFGANNSPPIIDTTQGDTSGVELYDSTGATPQTSMTPQVEYDVKVSVTDNNELKDLASVVVTLFYASPTALSGNAAAAQPVVLVGDTTGFNNGDAVIISDSLNSETNIILSHVVNTSLTMTTNLAYGYTTPTAVVAKVPTSSNTQTAAILTCTIAHPSLTITWAIDPNSSTTWSIGTCVPPTLTDSTGTFQFLFTPGKVAKANINPAKWFIYAKVTDQAASSATNCTHAPKDMNIYNEIYNLGGGPVSFGATDPGTTDKACATPIDAAYIANDNYKVQVRTDHGAGNAYWQNGATPPDDVTLQTGNGGSPNAGEFVLKAYETATIGSAKQVKLAYDLDIMNSRTITADVSGDDYPATTLWLSLGASNIPSGTYSGTIYFQISNR